MIWNAIKSICLYRLLISPEVETAVLCIALLACLFFGAFVKFKNGIVSLVAYLLLACVLITLVTIKVIHIKLPTEDLQLSDVKVEQYIAVDNGGIEFKRLFRKTVTEPLLGIQPLKEQQRVDDFVEFIKRTYPDGTIAYRTSKKYSGIILVDSAGNDLNIVLLREGYFNVGVKTPSQYLTAANAAKAKGVGIWADTVSSGPMQLIEFTFYICCFILGVLSTEYYFRYIKNYYISSTNIEERTYGEEEVSGRPAETTADKHTRSS